MTPEFQSWYGMNERRFTGDPKQAAWLAWQARKDARMVAQCRLESGIAQAIDEEFGEHP